MGPAALDEEPSGWFARSRVTRLGAYRLGRILRSARAAYNDVALQGVAEAASGSPEGIVREVVFPVSGEQTTALRRTERFAGQGVWVAGAGRFHNPDADLPADFAERRAECYEWLGLPPLPFHRLRRRRY